MTRYAFNEGTIVELNNAAKHCVHNPTPHHRIHLIFDYVEPSHVITRRTVLPAGQLCRQVRGRVELVDKVDVADETARKKRAGQQLRELEKRVSATVSADAAAALTTACRHYFIEQITAKAFVKTVKQRVLPPNTPDDDAFAAELWRALLEMFTLVDPRASDELARARVSKLFAPNWVIIGAQKCGTTSLYDYLSQHPQAMKGKRREPHFFDWAWRAALAHEVTPEDRATYAPVVVRYSAAHECGDERVEIPADVPLDGNSLDDMRCVSVCAL